MISKLTCVHVSLHVHRVLQVRMPTGGIPAPDCYVRHANYIVVHAGPQSQGMMCYMQTEVFTCRIRHRVQCLTGAHPYVQDPSPR